MCAVRDVRPTLLASDLCLRGCPIPLNEPGASEASLGTMLCPTYCNRISTWCSPFSEELSARLFAANRSGRIAVHSLLLPNGRTSGTEIMNLFLCEHLQIGRSNSALRHRVTLWTEWYIRHPVPYALRAELLPDLIKSSSRPCGFSTFPDGPAGEPIPAINR